MGIMMLSAIKYIRSDYPNTFETENNNLKVVTDNMNKENARVSQFLKQAHKIHIISNDIKLLVRMILITQRIRLSF